MLLQVKNLTIKYELLKKCALCSPPIEKIMAIAPVPPTQAEIEQKLPPFKQVLIKSLTLNTEETCQSMLRIIQPRVAELLLILGIKQGMNPVTAKN
jgi:hypothetical protein